MNNRFRVWRHRGMASLLTLAMMLTVMPAAVPPAQAAPIKTTETKFVVWDWIDDMQEIGTGADYNISNEDTPIPVGETKYSRIMFYQSVGGDRYYFNASPDGGNKSGDYYTTYHEDKIYLDSTSRIGNSANKEWNQDLIDGDHFVTVGGERTPYISYSEKREGYHAWRLWAANKDDTCSEYALMQVDDYEDLDLRRTFDSFTAPYSRYGSSNDSIRVDGWIIAKKAHIVPQSRWATYDNHVFWHWDNDTGGYDEALEFDLSDRKFRSWNIDTGGCDEFKIYLGKEYKVGTLAEDFTVQTDQAQTLGRPMYYIPKGRTITVQNHGVLTIDGVLFNDGQINVQEGGLLVLKDGAKIMPVTKYDNACGRISSSGNIVIGKDALLCGSANNGVTIARGGVVNFGILCAESMVLSRNDLVDNREGGWVVVGHSPTSAARIRFVREAIANEGVTAPIDVNNDFAKVGNADSSFTTQANSIYGDAADNVKNHANETAFGSATDPTVSIYTRDNPSDVETPLFENVMLDEVSLRVNGSKATYTVRNKSDTVENKLVSATIRRGDKSAETLFKDLWVGSLDGAYVRIEPVCASGKRLALSGGKAVSNAGAVIRKADDQKDQWWHLTSAGTVGVNQTYYIDNYENTKTALGLDLPGTGSAKNGDAVLLANHDGGNDQRWILLQSSGSTYCLRNAANSNVSLAVKGAGTADGTAVCVQTNSAYMSGQYWTIANLLTDDAYSDAVTYGTAVEFVPQSATGMRMALPAGAKDGQGVTLNTSAPDSSLQRWQLQPVGTDNLDGVMTPFYHLAEMTTGLVLSVNGSEAREGAGLTASWAAGRYTGGDLQYWYLIPAGGSDQYYITARANTNFVVSAPNSADPASGSPLTLSENKKEARQIWAASGIDAAMEEARQAAEGDGDDPLAGRAFELEPSDMSGWRLTSRGSSGFAVEILQNNAGKTRAKWQFKRLGADANGPYYQIVSDDPDAPLTALGRYMLYDASEDQQQVYLVDSKLNDKSQQWYVQANEDGTYTITQRDEPMLTLGREWGKAWNSYHAALTSGHSEKDESTRYVEYKYEYDPVRWNLIPEVYAPLDGKTFIMEPKHAPGMAAGVKDNSNDNSANVELQASKTNLYQMWTFEKAGAEELDGVMTPYYQIKNKASGMVLSAPYRSYVSSGQSLEQYTAENAVHQHWFSVLGDDGYYTLVSRLNSRVCLNVKDGGTTAGTDIQAYNKNDTNAQKWKLTDADSIDPLDGRVFYLAPKHTGKDKVLDLVGNGSGNGTQVQLYDKKETEIQRWKLERLGVDYFNGVKCNYYAIYSVYADGKALDTSGSTSNGARPHLWDYSASNKNQQWYVMDAGGGYYYIIPRSDTTKYLGVAGSSTSNNAAVELWDSNGDNRKWKLTETIVPETLGTYSILPKHAPGMHVGLTSSNSDNGTKLIIWEYNESSNYARWTFVKMGTDSGGAYYKIVNMANGKVIDATGNNTIQADSQLQQWDSDFNNDQLWYLNDAGQDENGFQYYNIVNRCDTDYCMDVSGGSTTHGTGVTVSKKNGGDSQKFRLMERFEPVELGTYEFGNPGAISMRLTVAGGSSSDGANIILYHRHTNNSNAGGKLQQFKIIQRGNDMIDGVKTPYYSIENLNGGKVLDPPGTGTASSEANVQQWSYDGYSDQHWYMNVLEDNTVIFRNRADSELVLETTGTTDDSNVRLGTYSQSGSLNQRWQLHPVMVTETVEASKGAEVSVQYYIPGNQAAVDAGLPFAAAENYYLNPAVGGKYTLTPQHATGLRMDLNSGSTDNGRMIWAYTNNGGGAQRWQFIPMGVDFFDGGGRIYYKIAYGSNANKVVQSANYWGPVTAAENLDIYDDEGCYDDQWYLEPATTGDGADSIYYLIGRGTMGKANKICIGVPGGATTSGTQLQTATLRSRNYQQWELEQVD